ncbi:MAG: AAA family ATPase, partial [Lysobacterales bacterium]
MLKHLHISNFAIVPSLELDFEPGFTAVTGETGAGKSILVGALGLLLGERSDANWVRPGEERAELTAEFDISANTGAQTWLAAAELETDDICLLRRTISNSGRSRAFINGSPVTVAQLQALGDRLVEIHGQNEHLQLTSPAAIFRLLDGSGSYAQELTAVTDAHNGWRQAQDALETLEQDSAVPAAELEFLKFQLDELQQFDLDADAIAELQAEHDRLAAGDALLEAVRDSMQRLDPEPGGDMDGVNSGLNRALDDLRAFEHLDQDIAASCQMLQEASVNTIEAVNALRAAMERIDTDPARFEAVDDELGRLNGLARKHGVAMEALAGVRDTLAARVEAAGDSAERRDELKARAGALLERYREAARALHEKRRAHAAELAQ